MADYRYVVARCSLTSPRIDRLEVVKKTARFITVSDGNFCFNVHSAQFKRYHDTWEEAHAQLNRWVESELSDLRLRLQQLQDVADNVMGMKSPADEPSPHQEVE